jgi:hypothetical protein
MIETCLRHKALHEGDYHVSLRCIHQAGGTLRNALNSVYVVECKGAQTSELMVSSLCLLRDILSVPDLSPVECGAHKVRDLRVHSVLDLYTPDIVRPELNLELRKLEICACIHDNDGRQPVSPSRHSLRSGSCPCRMWSSQSQRFARASDTGTVQNVHQKPKN